MHKKIKFIHMKIHKAVATTAAPFGPDMHQSVCRLRLRPRPHWGSLQRSPRPPSWISGGGLLLRQGRTVKWEGGKGGGGGREREEGNGRAGSKILRISLAKILDPPLQLAEIEWPPALISRAQNVSVSPQTPLGELTVLRLTP